MFTDILFPQLCSRKFRWVFTA